MTDQNGWIKATPTAGLCISKKGHPIVTTVFFRNYGLVVFVM